jgi:hypothetical protein
VVPALAEAAPDGRGGWEVRWHALPTAGPVTQVELEQEVSRLATLYRQRSQERPRGGLMVAGDTLRAELLADLEEIEAGAADAGLAVEEHGRSWGEEKLGSLLEEAGAILERLREFQAKLLAGGGEEKK